MSRLHLGYTASVLTVAVALLAGCSGDDESWPKDRSGPKVVVSFAPLYCFAVNVAGEDAVVRNMMTTTGPHHFNPTDRDARLLRRADVFLINGLGLEGDKPESMKRSSGNKRLRLMELGERIPKVLLCEGSCQHNHGPDEPHDHGTDPHVWLSPDEAVYLVEGIREALSEADPAHAEGYNQRAREYVERLQKLKADGLEMLKDKKDRKLVTFHESMAYFARCFKLNVVGVVQKNPGSEPNSKELQKLINLCADETHPVRVITVEPQYAMTTSGGQLIKELQRKNVPDPVLVEIDPLETVVPEQLNAGWYEAKMRANLEALAKAMR